MFIVVVRCDRTLRLILKLWLYGPILIFLLHLFFILLYHNGPIRTWILRPLLFLGRVNIFDVEYVWKQATVWLLCQTATVSNRITITNHFIIFIWRLECLDWLVNLATLVVCFTGRIGNLIALGGKLFDFGIDNHPLLFSILIYLEILYRRYLRAIFIGIGYTHSCLDFSPRWTAVKLILGFAGSFIAFKEVAEHIFELSNNRGLTTFRFTARIIPISLSRLLLVYLHRLPSTFDPRIHPSVRHLIFWSMLRYNFQLFLDFIKRLPTRTRTLAPLWLISQLWI